MPRSSMQLSKKLHARREITSSLCARLYLATFQSCELLDADELVTIFGNAETILGVHVELLQRLEAARTYRLSTKKSLVSVRRSVRSCPSSNSTPRTVPLVCCLSRGA